MRNNWKRESTAQERPFYENILLAIIDDKYIYPQYPFTEIWGKKRYIDFAIITPNTKLAIELDDYDSHMRKANQAKFADDKKRDNELQIAGWITLHFTYLQFQKEPEFCKSQIKRMLQNDKSIKPRYTEISNPLTISRNESIENIAPSQKSSTNMQPKVASIYNYADIPLKKNSENNKAVEQLIAEINSPTSQNQVDSGYNYASIPVKKNDENNKVIETLPSKRNWAKIATLIICIFIGGFVGKIQGRHEQAAAMRDANVKKATQQVIATQSVEQLPVQKVVTQPINADDYNNRGYDYYKKGKFDLAISDYTKAIELNPQYAEAYFRRGCAYEKKGRFDLAKSDYAKAKYLF